jgi:hypothetical protein
MPSGRRTKLLTLMLLALVFASGLVVGLALDRSAAEAVTADAATESQDEDRDSDEGSRRVPMYQQVGLREGQEERIDSIVRHHRSSMRALEAEFEVEYESMRELQKQFRDAYNPRYWAIIDSTRTEIKAVLDTEQAARYDSLLAEFDRRRRSERSDTTGR